MPQRGYPRVKHTVHEEVGCMAPLPVPHCGPRDPISQGAHLWDTVYAPTLREHALVSLPTTAGKETRFAPA